MNKKLLIILTTSLLLIYGNLVAQEKQLSSSYVGLIPSVLIEPYDTINAIEVNCLPFLYEFRLGSENNLSIQFRPILNYRFLKDQNGFSQIGGTVLMNKYFLNVFKDDFWLKPQLGIYYTYAFNRLDKIQTMTLGIEPGAFIRISKSFSLSVNLQPGINYYPDKRSQNFVGTKNGFKSHFGIIIHAGYNLGK